MDELLTTKEVAIYMRVHKNTLRRLVKRGQFPGAFKVDARGDWRFSQQTIDEWIRQQEGEYATRHTN